MSEAARLDPSQVLIEFDMDSLPPIPTSKPKGPRDLREVIPAGKGRFSKGDVGVQEYLGRIRAGQRCGIQSALKLHGCELSQDWRQPSVVCIAGGGPSLQDEVGALRHLLKRGAKSLAVNKSHDWLLKRGLPCHYSALLDPKDWVAGYVDLNLAKSAVIRKRAGKLWAETRHLIASQCHDLTIAKFRGGANSYLWHAGAGVGESTVLNTEFANEDWINITGASVIGLRAVGIGYGLGFRAFHLFGVDGSSKMPTDAEMQIILRDLSEGGKPAEPLSSEQIKTMLFTMIERNLKLPAVTTEILKKYLYSYGKPHIDATWKAFNVKLDSGWERAFMSNHHMARSVYEFEDSMRHWDSEIKAGKMEPFTVRVHGNPEHSAIAMVAAGMGVHADAAENEKYGCAP